MKQRRVSKRIVPENSTLYHLSLLSMLSAPLCRFHYGISFSSPIASFPFFKLGFNFQLKQEVMQFFYAMLQIKKNADFVMQCNHFKNKDTVVATRVGCKRRRGITFVEKKNNGMLIVFFNLNLWIILHHMSQIGEVNRETGWNKDWSRSEHRLRPFTMVFSFNTI